MLTYVTNVCTYNMLQMLKYKATLTFGHTQDLNSGLPWEIPADPSNHHVPSWALEGHFQKLY